jgi:hypothetical protein
LSAPEPWPRGVAAPPTETISPTRHAKRVIGDAAGSGLELSPSATGRAVEKTNLAARTGRWSAAHWKTAFLGWFVLCLAVFIAGMALDVRVLSSTDTDSGESQRADRILERDFPARAAESVLVQSRTQTLSNPRFRAAIEDVVHTLSALSRVRNVRSPLGAHAGGQISKDGRSALVQFQLRGDPATAVDRVQPILDAVAAAQARNRAFTVAEFGSASANHTVNKTLRKDLQKAEFLSLVVTLVILLVAFGALVAAGASALAWLRRVSRHARPQRARQPPPGFGTGDASGDPADRLGPQRGLLALLHPAGA